MTGSFARGAPTFNSMFFKPMMRKSFQKKASSHDMMRETALKSNAEEGNVMRSQQMNNNVGENEGNCGWVPHERTGIYYPKGHEKVIDDVPPSAGRDFEVNWFSETHG
ncbi:hypothetical protein CUMW_189340 [Citrus unshiu]|nr:hypothetical protein CUMW_189340 [Citrus unshiu]